MESIILMANKVTMEELKNYASFINDAKAADFIALAEAAAEGFDIGTLIPTDHGNIGTSLVEALNIASANNIIIIDAQNKLSSLQIKALMQAAAQVEDQNFAYISIEGELDNEEVAALDAESLLNLTIQRKALPFTALVCKKAFLQSCINDQVENIAELALRAATKAVSAGAEIIPITQFDANQAALCEMSNASLARSLSYMVNSFTIEELFPKHDWKNHTQESAAASYHTLAAYFIRFEDYLNAAECLSISDQFEESPRSFALRALIAFNKGETLGAVANLVSSLQQYEERKKSESHYVKFSPSNVEIINSSLVSGLDALNNRDNDKALDHFAKAVFNFDGFYAQHGLERMIH